MKFLNQLVILGQTWTGSLAILGMVLVLLILRRFLPAAQRTRVRLPLFFLGLSLVLGLSAAAKSKDNIIAHSSLRARSARYPDCVPMS